MLIRLTSLKKFLTMQELLANSREALISHMVSLELWQMTIQSKKASIMKVRRKDTVEVSIKTVRTTSE